MSEFSILSLNNYKSHFDGKSIHLYSKKYIELIQEFIIYAQENIEISDLHYYKFIIQKGIDTIKHIFNNLFLYTKHLELTIHHCRKVFVYYIEFIQQIGDGTNSFFQLNSKDAILFIYKKTIFEINNEYRKNYSLDDDDLDILNTIKTIHSIFDELLKIIVNREGEKLKGKDDGFFDSITIIINIMNNIIKFKEMKEIDNENLHDILKTFLYFIQNIVRYDMDTVKFLNIQLQMSRKMYKKNISQEKIKEKIFDLKNFDIMLQESPLKFTNWMYN